MTDCYINDHCEGCRGYTRGIMFAFEKNLEVHCCSYINFNQNCECPCCICIIKVMCLEACENFDRFKTYSENPDRVFISGERGVND